MKIPAHITEEIVTEAVKSCKSRSECFKKLNIKYHLFLHLIDLFKINIDHFPGKDGKLNLIGKKFNRLLVLSEGNKKPDGRQLGIVFVIVELKKK